MLDFARWTTELGLRSPASLLTTDPTDVELSYLNKTNVTTYVHRTRWHISKKQRKYAKPGDVKESGDLHALNGLKLTNEVLVNRVSIDPR